MDQELVLLLQSPDRERAAKGAQMLAAFLSRASFPSKSVQALREVTSGAFASKTVLDPCVCVRVRAIERACVRACVRGCLSTYLRAACVRACVPACVRACVHACVREPHLAMRRHARVSAQCVSAHACRRTLLWCADTRGTRAFMVRRHAGHTGSSEGCSGYAPFACFAPCSQRRAAAADHPGRPRRTLQGGMLGPALPAWAIAAG